MQWRNKMLVKTENEDKLHADVIRPSFGVSTF